MYQHAIILQWQTESVRITNQKNIDGFLHSAIAGNPPLYQVKDSSTQLHTLSPYIAKFFAISKHCWTILNTNTLLRYTQH